MGMIQVTVQNLQIIKVDAQNNILAIKGAVPGNVDNYLLIKTAKKKKAKVASAAPLKTQKQPAKKK
jgi:large subunit ribosomal protein L3